MYDALGVCFSEALGYLGGDRHGLLKRDGTGFDPGLKVLPFDALHHDEGLALGLVDLVDRAYVGMIESRRRFRLMDEACLLRISAEDARGEKLEGNAPLEFRVVGLVDDAHAAFA